MEDLETRDEYSNARQLIHCSPLLIELEIIKRIRLDWSAVKKQGNVLPLCFKRKVINQCSLSVDHELSKENLEVRREEWREQFMQSIIYTRKLQMDTRTNGMKVIKTKNLQGSGETWM